MDYVDQWNRNRVDWLYKLARSPELSPAAVRVGLLFATFLQAEEREEVRPGYEWLTKHAHMSRATLSKAIRELERAGYIRVDRWHRERSAYGLAFDGDGKFEPKSLSSKNGL